VRKFDLGRSFSAGYTREDGPPKPSPEGCFACATSSAVAPADTLVVGDYKFDVLAGRSAGCRTALVTAEEITDLADWGSPDYLVRSLRELLPIWS